VLKKAPDLNDSNPARALVLRFLGEFPKMCADDSSAAGGNRPAVDAGGIAYADCGTVKSDPPELKPGEIRNFIKCPAGKFWMGAGRKDRNVMSRGIEWSYPSFWLQTTAVTVAQYRLFDPRHTCPGSDDCPVTKVSWYDAWVFALWVGGLAADGGPVGIRLPGGNGNDSLNDLMASLAKARVVRSAWWKQGSPGGHATCESLGFVRHARECLGVVLGLVMGTSGR
jgi:hypothetical protein